MRVGLHARRRAHEDPLHARLGRELDLVRRIEDDEPGARPRSGLELLDALVVPVDDQPVARDPCPQRDRQLTQSRDVRAQTFPGQKPEHADVRKRLHAVRDERVRCRGAVSAGRLEHRSLVVDEERRAVLGREARRSEAGDRQLAALDGGRYREELEHRPILPAARW